jgi:hypothetical protein
VTEWYVWSGEDEDCVMCGKAVVWQEMMPRDYYWFGLCDGCARERNPEEMAREHPEVEGPGPKVLAKREARGVSEA